MGVKIETCSVCGKDKKVWARDNGLPVCQGCQNLRNAEMCAGCGKVKPVARRIGDLVLCSPCRQKKFPEVCYVCGREKPVVSRHDGAPLCDSCGRKCSIKRFFSTYKRNAKIRGISFNISIEQFESIIVLPCVYCGDRDVQDPPRVGVDRIDNNRSYTLENCSPCCSKCNHAKARMSKNEFIDLCYKITKQAGLL